MRLMVGREVGSYSFNHTAKTITLAGLPPLRLEQVCLIVNATDGLAIFNEVDSSKTATLANNVLTLAYDTTAMADTDSLQIFVDLARADYPQPVQDASIPLLRRMVKLLEAMGNVDAQPRQRVSVDVFPATIPTVTTVGTVTTCSTVSNVAAIATVAGM